MGETIYPFCEALLRVRKENITRLAYLLLKEISKIEEKVTREVWNPLEQDALRFLQDNKEKWKRKLGEYQSSLEEMQNGYLLLKRGDILCLAMQDSLANVAIRCLSE